MKVTKLHCILYCAYLALIALIAQPFIPPTQAGLMQSQSCPYGHIEASSEACCGKEYIFNGSVSGWDPAIKPIVKWIVSAGRITSGQGTWSIKVDASELGGKTITVTLKVTGDGLPKACEVEETYTTKPCP